MSRCAYFGRVCWKRGPAQKILCQQHRAQSCQAQGARGSAARALRAGLGASELYVVKSGEFEVLQRRKGVNIRVNMKRRGDTFGEVRRRAAH